MTTPPITLAPGGEKISSLDDVPQRKLFHMAVKVYMLGSLVWDYTDTVLDLAVQMRISETKKVTRAIRALHDNYNRLRAQDFDSDHVKKEWELAELFESINKEAISRLCNGLITEIRHDATLNRDYEMIVEAVQMAMTIIDTMQLYAAKCDAFIFKYYPRAQHSIMPDHFRRLAILLPQYAGDCYRNHSDARYVTARILLNEIDNIELYE